MEILNIHENGKFSIKRNKTTWDVGKINYLKCTKREILLVEIWLKSADANRKEAKNKKWVFWWYPKGANMHWSQENS